MRTMRSTGFTVPERIRRVDDRDHLRPRREEPFELLHHELAAIVHRRDAQHGARPRADLLPRHDVGVVLHRRDEHLVAGTEVLVAP